MRFGAKAAYQLEKVLEFANEAKGEILEALNIPLEEWPEISKIQLYPMIVARQFEGDQIYFRNFPKLSLLELNVILTNGLDNLYGTGFEDHRFLHDMENSGNSHYQPKARSPRKDLWNGHSEPSPEAIIEAIEQAKVWQEFHDTWEY